MEVVVKHEKNWTLQPGINNFCTVGVIFPFLLFLILTFSQESKKIKQFLFQYFCLPLFSRTILNMRLDVIIYKGSQMTLFFRRLI